jgi:hypothetical protein
MDKLLQQGITTLDKQQRQHLQENPDAPRARPARPVLYWSRVLTAATPAARLPAAAQRLYLCWNAKDWYMQ